MSDAKTCPSVRERSVTIRSRAWSRLETDGPGPSVVLLPGAQGTGGVFGTQLNALGDRLRMLALHYPGDPDAVALADDLARLLDVMGIARTSLLGSSYGGYWAQIFAARHPDRIDRLLLSSTFIDPAPQHALLRSLVDMDATALHARVLDGLRASAEGALSQAELKRLLIEEVGLRQTPENLHGRFLGVARATPAPPVGLPADRIIIIDSDDDPVIPAVMREQLANRYPTAHRYRLAGGGHYPAVLCADAYTAILRTHLLHGDSRST